MKKNKKFHIIIIVVVLIIGYLNYFKDEKKEKIEEKTEVITKNVDYKGNDYEIFADKQTDFLNKDESFFNMARAVVENLVLTGDNAILDKDKNLFLNSNVKGKSLDGWEFQSETFKFERKKKEISSETGIFLKNEKEKTEISGNKFKSDTQMTKMIIEGNAVIVYGDMTLKSHILMYNKETTEIEVPGKYEITQPGMKMNGVNLKLNRNSGKISGGKIKIITDKNENFEAGKVEGNLNKGKINFTKNPKGRTYQDKEPIDYNGELLILYLRKENKKYIAEKIVLEKNATLKNKSSTLYSKRTDIDLITKIAISIDTPKTIIQDERNGETVITSDTLEFNMNKKRIYLKENVIFNNNNPKKGRTKGTGKFGVINTEKKIIELEKNAIVDAPEAIIYADKIIYKSETRKIDATGNVIVDYKKIKGEKDDKFNS